MYTENQQLAITAAKQAEHNNFWLEAAKHWRNAGNIDEAKTCENIAAANAKGDAYRAEVLEVAGPEPDRSIDAHGWVKWYAAMSEIYNKHFPNVIC